MSDTNLRRRRILAELEKLGPRRAGELDDDDLAFLAEDEAIQQMLVDVLGWTPAQVASAVGHG